MKFILTRYAKGIYLQFSEHYYYYSSYSIALIVRHELPGCEMMTEQRWPTWWPPPSFSRMLVHQVITFSTVYDIKSKLFNRGDRCVQVCEFATDANDYSPPTSLLVFNIIIVFSLTVSLVSIFCVCVGWFRAIHFLSHVSALVS